MSRQDRLIQCLHRQCLADRLQIVCGVVAIQGQKQIELLHCVTRALKLDNGRWGWDRAEVEDAITARTRLPDAVRDAAPHPAPLLAVGACEQPRLDELRAGAELVTPAVRGFDHPRDLVRWLDDGYALPFGEGMALEATCQPGATGWTVKVRVVDGMRAARAVRGPLADGHEVDSRGDELFAAFADAEPAATAAVAAQRSGGCLARPCPAAGGLSHPVSLHPGRHRGHQRAGATRLSGRCGRLISW